MEVLVLTTSTSFSCSHVESLLWRWRLVKGGRKSSCHGENFGLSNGCAGSNPGRRMASEASLDSLHLALGSGRPTTVEYGPLYFMADCYL